MITPTPSRFPMLPRHLDINRPDDPSMRGPVKVCIGKCQGSFWVQKIFKIVDSIPPT